ATKPSINYRLHDSGVIIYGDGEDATRLTRGVTEQDLYLQSQSMSLAGAIFAVHGSYNTVKDVGLFHAPVGIYFGREAGASARRHTSFNKMSSILLHNCDSAIVSWSSEGHYYN